MNEPATISAPPIPLTRVAGAESELHPGTYRGVAPPFAVGQLGQLRPTPPPEALTGEEPPPRGSVPPSIAPEAEAEAEANSRVSLFAPSSDELQTALSDLAVAENPDDVVDALVVGLGRIAKEVLVFATRAGSFRSRARSDLGGRARKETSIELGPGEHTLSQSLEFGQYLGPIGEDGPELAFLSEPYDEVCVTRVDVSDRPTLVLLAGGFLSAYDVSLRSDHLARAAADALMRIVMAKKR